MSDYNNQCCYQNEKGSAFLEKYISEAIQNKTMLSVYLMNGIRLDGTIIDIDFAHRCLKIMGPIQNKIQIVFLHAISTITPAINKNVDNSANNGASSI